MNDDKLAQVAPELRHALEMFPAADYTLEEGLHQRRAAMAAMSRPPLPQELTVVRWKNAAPQD